MFIVNIESFAGFVTPNSVGSGQSQLRGVSVDPELEWHHPIVDCGGSGRGRFGGAYGEKHSAKSTNVDIEVKV